MRWHSEARARSQAVAEAGAVAPAALAITALLTTLTACSSTPPATRDEREGVRDALVLVPRGTMDEVKVQVVPRESSERTAVTRPGEQQRVAFWFSLAVEVPVALAFCARSRRTALATAGAALVATGLTHPVAWWAITFLTPRLGWAGATALVELTLTAFEVLPYRLVVRVSWRRALVTSLVANAASFVLGQL